MRRYYTDTENVAAIVGMAAALQTNCTLLKKNQQHITNLEQQLMAKLNEAGVTYKYHGGCNKLPGFLSLSFPDKDGEFILLGKKSFQAIWRHGCAI